MNHEYTKVFVKPELCILYQIQLLLPYCWRIFAIVVVSFIIIIRKYICTIPHQLRKMSALSICSHVLLHIFTHPTYPILIYIKKISMALLSYYLVSRLSKLGKSNFDTGKRSRQVDGICVFEAQTYVI